MSSAASTSSVRGGPGHRPAHYPAAEHVEDDGELEEAAPGRDVRDVGDPERVGAVGRELALDEVRPLRRTGLASGRRRASASTDTDDPRRAHESGHPLLADAEALVLRSSWIRSTP